MLHVQILGPSCGKCVRLESMVTEILTQLGMNDAHIEKIADQQIIDKYLIEEPPGLLINDSLYWAGGDLPEPEQLKAWLQAAVLSNA